MRNNIYFEHCSHCQQVTQLEFIALEDSGAELLGIFKCAQCHNDIVIMAPEQSVKGWHQDHLPDHKTP